MKIDQILLKVGSGHSMLTVADWSGMKLTERIDAINEDRVQFVSGSQPVDTTDALEAIKVAQGS